MDRKLASTFSGQPTKEELMKIYRQNALFMAGSYLYPESKLTIATTPETKRLSSNIIPGMRFPTSRSTTVIAQCDKSPIDLQKAMLSDGRFRVVVLPGDILRPSAKKRLDALAKPLLALIKRYMYTPAANPLVSLGSGHKNTKPRSLIDVLTVHKADDLFRVDLVQDFGPPYIMFDEDFGYDYYKVYADYETDYSGGGKAYAEYGVDPEVGCMVAVRPDQMVGWVGTLEDIEGLSRYFTGFLKETPLETLTAKKAESGT